MPARGHPLKRLLSQARYRAKLRGQIFTVKFEDLDIPEFCPVFGLKLKHTLGRRKDTSFSIDRRDNAKGYTKENTRIISWRANYMKGNLTVQEVKKLLEYMQE